MKCIWKIDSDKVSLIWSPKIAPVQHAQTWRHHANWAKHIVEIASDLATNVLAMEDEISLEQVGHRKEQIHNAKTQDDQVARFQVLEWLE